MSGPLRVLVVGAGGREHALAWRLQRDQLDGPIVRLVMVAPGNGGIAAAGIRCCRADSVDDWVALAVSEHIDLVVIGPEAPLVAGLADRLRAVAIPVLGPNHGAAMLEASKALMKDVAKAANVYTADFVVVTHSSDAAAWIAARQGRVVIKADGLCAGKGVVVCDDEATALTTLRRFLGEDGTAPAFGDASRRVVVEERLSGPELSVFALCDGLQARMIGVARDHKRLLDGDRGPNTGGMGAVFPVRIDDTDTWSELIRQRVFLPVLAELERRHIPFHGVLFAGLMMTSKGPALLEFNVRFGDPECEAMMTALDGPLASLCWHAATGRLDSGPMVVANRTAATVVMAAGGYPEAPRSGATIIGIDDANAIEGVRVFCAGVSRHEPLSVQGGRVLAVTASGASMDEALQRAYQGVACIHFDGAHHRKDIGMSVRSGF
jgi:phosphoribosylamine---glycine ligase